MRYNIIPPFRQSIRLALRDVRVHHAIKTTLSRLAASQFTRRHSTSHGEEVRQANALRKRTLSEQKTLVTRLVAEIERKGGNVHWVPTRADVPDVFHRLLGVSAHRVVTVSDAVLEELQVAEALRASGHHVDLVDIGGALLDSSGEPPVHLLYPLVHMSTRDVAHTIQKQWGQRPPQSTEALFRVVVQHAEALCKKADVAVLMGHFAIAESGSVVLLDSDGSRMLAAALAPHVIVVLGVEQILPEWKDVGTAIRAYESAMPAKFPVDVLTLSPVEHRGSRRVDFVLVDNGRFQVADTPYAEALMCIHCGACALGCPLFREVGGQVYGTPYVGPIGALLSPYLFEKETGDWARACTLCGTCALTCPVGIDLPAMMARRRLSLHFSPSLQAGVRAWQRWLDVAPPIRRLMRFLSVPWSVGKRRGLRIKKVGWPLPAAQSLAELWDGWNETTPK